MTLAVPWPAVNGRRSGDLTANPGLRSLGGQWQIAPAPDLDSAMTSTQDETAGPVLVFIPSYNDNATAVAVARDVAALGSGYRPLVIDDGSREPLDASRLPAGALSFRMPDNFGIGIATHVALDHALAEGYRALIRLDGDGQHPVATAPELIARLDRGEADVVAGIRINRGEGEGAGVALRNAAKAYYAWMAGLLSGGRTPADVNTGLFALNRKAMAAVNAADLERFPEPQMFVAAARAGLRIVTHDTVQEPRREGETTLGLWSALRMFYRFNVFVLDQVLGGRR
ncbi:MAG: glycosyltransferase family 2 protein [Alphaproteobacteria bacterium]|nr:glycosyltransferase family 2 protein [Alphaproteobacteria bacterium]